MKRLRELYYKLFPKYKILNSIFTDYATADRLIKNTENNLPSEKWVLYTEKEDYNHTIGKVYICQKIRITS